MHSEDSSTNYGYISVPGAISEPGNGAPLADDELVMLAKIVMDELKLRAGESRARIDDALMQAFEEMGVTQREIRVNGKKVATHYVQGGKPTIRIKPGYQQMAMEELDKRFLVDKKPRKGWESSFIDCGDCVIDKLTGEVAEWLEVGESPRRTSLRTTAGREEIIALLSERIGAASIVGLLTGGEQ